MTLKQKILADNYLEDYENPITDYQADNIIEIADNYAIDSIQYTIDNFFNGKLAGLNSKEIFEQFKKEKGLCD
jgi:hypothetical protein